MCARRFSNLVPEPTRFSESPRAVGHGSVWLDSSEVTSLYHARNPPPHQAGPAIYRQAQEFTDRTQVQLYLTEVALCLARFERLIDGGEGFVIRTTQ
jgi:hypothetical protein